MTGIFSSFILSINLSQHEYHMFYDIMRNEFRWGRIFYERMLNEKIGIFRKNVAKTNIDKIVDDHSLSSCLKFLYFVVFFDSKKT